MSRSAERALSLLKVLAKGEKGMGLMEIAGAANLDKSTTSRLLESLMKHDFVYRDPQSKVFGVGTALLSLAATVSKRSQVLRVVRPFLERLRDLSGETTSFYLRLGDGRVCVDGVESHHDAVRLLPLGEAAPLHHGTSSKVILAGQTDSEVAGILDRLEVFGDDRAVTLEKVDMIRRQGYYAAIGERLPGVATISVPVRSGALTVAAITMSGPEGRWTLERMREFAPTLLEIADDVSALMMSSDLRVYSAR